MDYADLKLRVKQFKKYERILDFLSDYWFFAVFIGAIISSFWTPSTKELTLETAISIFAVVGVWMGITYLVSRKMKKHRLEDDEWATFYTNSILQNLEKFSQTKNLERQEDYRKKAIKNGKDFLVCIERRWKIGTFKLAQEYFGKSLFDLKENIRYRIIPALKDGDSELLGKVEQIMRNFTAPPIILSLEKINKLNEDSSGRLPNRKPIQVGLRGHLSIFLSTHRILKHGLIVFSFLIICVIFYYMVITFQWASKDYAFAGSIAVFIGLLTIYSAKQRK
jgi:hypothetical protein